MMLISPNVLNQWSFFYLPDDAIIRFQPLRFFLRLPFCPPLQEFLTHGA